MKMTSSFQALLQGFFVEWLTIGRNVSPQTVSAYRDTFTILIRWLSSHRGLSPDKISMPDITMATVEGFLVYLVEERGNSANTANCRLAAIKSFCRYTSYRAPDFIGELGKIIAITKRTEKAPVLLYLEPREVGWIIAACPNDTCNGKQTKLLLRLLYNTGARISELLSLKVRDFRISDDGKCRITILGKGRKERCLPIWDETIRELQGYLACETYEENDFVFSGRNVEHLTRSGARSRIEGAVKRACVAHPGLRDKRITPHVFRHSTAMAMLVAGVDLSTIAIWLGHESIQTTHRYMVSDMKLKEEAIDKARYDWGTGKQTRYKADAKVLRFLKSL
jgi:site-specific recombinase XerD